MTRLLQLELVVAAVGTATALVGHGFHCTGLEQAASFLAVSGLSLLVARALEDPCK
jgi:hypothetical protein